MGKCFCTLRVDCRERISFLVPKLCFPRRISELEFPSGEVNELLVNIIDELMHAKCDVSGYKFLLLNSFINYRKSNEVVASSDYMVNIKCTS